MKYFNMRCKYSEIEPPRLMPNEYVITFKCLERKNPGLLLNGEIWPPEDEEWCIVLKEDVRPEEGKKDNNSGLVKIVIKHTDFDKGKALVGIFSSPEEEIEDFVVPISEIQRK